MGDKGLLSKKREKWVAKFLDSLFYFGKIGEIFDRTVFLGIIVFLDDFILVGKYSTKLKEIFDEFITLIEARDYLGLDAYVAEKVAELVNTPLGDVAEKAVLVNAMAFLNSYIQMAVEKGAEIADKAGEDPIIDE